MADQYMLMYPSNQAPAFLFNVTEDCVQFPAFDVCFSHCVLPYTLLFEPVRLISIAQCEKEAPWHLQRISQQKWSTQDYIYDPQVKPKPVYILDSGVDLNHLEFENRVSNGPVYFQSPTLHPHGTHVAGLVGSRTFGVSKKVKMVSVRILDEHGEGNSAVVVKALGWLVKQKPSIVNLSIGGGFSEIINRAIDTLSQLGWVVVVAAGNSHTDACKTSPASAKTAVTVGAFDKTMKYATFSNHGKCVDVLAPGVDIVSTFPDQQHAIWSGTSMATPIVAGIFANMGWLGRSEMLNRFKKLPNLVQDLPDLVTPNLMAFQPHWTQCPSINSNFQWQQLFFQ